MGQTQDARPEPVASHANSQTVDIDANTIRQICYGTGITRKLDPSKPKPKSLRFTMCRNARTIGYAYVSPDAADPQAAAFAIGRPYDCNEAWHGTPCEQKPLPWLTENCLD